MSIYVYGFVVSYNKHANVNVYIRETIPGEIVGRLHKIAVVRVRPVLYLIIQQREYFI